MWDFMHLAHDLLWSQWFSRSVNSANRIVHHTHQHSQHFLCPLHTYISNQYVWRVIPEDSVISWSLTFSKPEQFDKESLIMRIDIFMQLPEYILHLYNVVVWVRYLHHITICAQLLTRWNSVTCSVVRKQIIYPCIRTQYFVLTLKLSQSESVVRGQNLYYVLQLLHFI